MNIPAPFSENQMRFFWNCFNHWFNVAEGGKRGGKNVLITMAYCTILEKHPSRIHLIAGVSTATALKEKARDSVLHLLSRLQAEQTQRKPGEQHTAVKSEARGDVY